VGFGDRRRAKQLAHQAELDERQRGYVTALLDEIAGHAALLDLPLAVKPGERALYVMRGVGLFEPRSAGGNWVGRSSGVSVPIGNTRMRLRVGQSKGHYVHAPEEPTVIDTGDATVTDRRIVFQGTKQIREWQLTKLLGFTHDAHRCATAIQVSNREKVSGLIYKGIDPERVHLAMAVAAAIAEGHEAAAVAELHTMLPAATPDPQPPSAAPPASPPAPRADAPAVTTPVPPIAAAAPPEWAPDPARRHQYRYWDGRTWTAQVSDNGVTGEDPLLADG
jgi:hypothetical protein